jgi:hypothetical protein
MPVVATDLVCFASANMPLDDTATAGGAIDLLRRVVFTDISATGTVEILSDGADTRNVTIAGRLASGVYTSEVLALNGATPVVSTNSYERIESAEAASTSATRTVTVRKASDDVLIGTIPINERGFMRLFINSLSDPSATKTYYTLIYWRNLNGTSALLAAHVDQSADPTGKINHGLGAAKGDLGTITNRVTAPAAITFDDANKNVPGTNLGAGEHIGTWLRLSLGVGDAPAKSTYTIQIVGDTA